MNGSNTTSWGGKDKSARPASAVTWNKQDQVRFGSCDSYGRVAAELNRIRRRVPNDWDEFKSSRHD